jgi:large subunit ribosomal protein L10e
MASLRKAKCYRNVDRAYTRKSKYKKKGFIKSPTASKVVKFHMGNTSGEFKNTLKLVATEAYQVRHNSLEAVRVMINRKLSRKLGSKGYHFYLNIYPHHILRENKMLTGAGADRMQSGMKHAFGKASGSAAQVKKGTTLFTVLVDDNVQEVKGFMEAAMNKLPGRTTVEVC